MTTHNVATAAEAAAAERFARFGCKIGVQYGASQPEYHLTVERDEKVLLVSVKGSQTGSWGLTSKISKANYHAAIDAWLGQHGRRTVFCLVQYKDVGDDMLPRMFLATPAEIAEQLKRSRGGKGHGRLTENHLWTERAASAGTVDRLPERWKMSRERVDELLNKIGD